MKTFSEFIAEAAEKRMKMVRVHHGTSSDSAEKIKKSGFKVAWELYSTVNPVPKDGLSGKVRVRISTLPPVKSAGWSGVKVL